MMINGDVPAVMEDVHKTIAPTVCSNVVRWKFPRLSSRISQPCDEDHPRKSEPVNCEYDSHFWGFLKWGDPKIWMVFVNGQIVSFEMDDN